MVDYNYRQYPMIHYTFNGMASNIRQFIKKKNKKKYVPTYFTSLMLLNKRGSTSRCCFLLIHVKTTSENSPRADITIPFEQVCVNSCVLMWLFGCFPCNHLCFAGTCILEFGSLQFGSLGWVSLIMLVYPIYFC